MAVDRKNFDPKELSVRRVDGRPAYSQAVSVEGTRQIHIAGQLARELGVRELSSRLWTSVRRSQGQCLVGHRR